MSCVCPVNLCLIVELLSILTISILVVELLTDLPTEFPGNNQLITHLSVGVTLAEFKPLLVVWTQPTPPHMMACYIATSTIIIPSLRVVWTQPTPPCYLSTLTLK